MPRFRYRALRRSGDPIEGELVADDERAAALHLQSAGSFPVEIAPASSAPALPRRGGRKLSARESVLLTRQLAALLGAGVALDRALALIAGERTGRRARLAASLRAAVERGESLSRAWTREGAFPRTHATVIAAGEARGDVAGALARLALIVERNDAIRQSIVGALIYPASVLVVACLSVAFLLGFVVPRFAGLLAGVQHQPPLAMRALLAVSSFVQNDGLWAAAAIVALAALLVVQWRLASFRLAVDRGLLALPGIGTLLRKIEAERLAFLLGTMVAAGVGVPTAIAAAREGAAHEALGAALADAGRFIERGDGLTAALAASRLLPDMAVELVRIGEETGDLAPMLLKAGDILHGEIAATTTHWIGLVTPLAMIVLGLLIGGIALAIFETVLETYDVAL